MSKINATSVIIGADAVGPKNDLFVTIIEPKEWPKPQFLLQNLKHDTSSARFYLAVISELKLKLREKNVKVRGTIFDSYNENIQLMKQLNEESMNICNLSAVLKLMREVRDTEDDITLDGSSLDLGDRKALFTGFSKTLSCATDFVHGDFTQLIDKLKEACGGPAKDHGVALFTNIGKLVSIIVKPTEISNEVIKIVESVCRDCSRLNHAKLTGGLVIMFNIQLALTISIELEGDTTTWSLFHLDDMFKPYNKSPSKKFADFCETANTEFRFLNGHKKYWETKNDAKEYAAPQLTLTHGFE